MIVCNISTIEIREPLPIATGVGGLPYLIYDIFCKAVRHSFTMETGILSTHHIEQYAEAGIIACDMWYAGPILRTKAPSDAIGGLIICRMCAIVLCIKEDDVDAYLRRLCLQLAGYLEKYSHTTGAVIGSKNGSAVILRVGVGICPRAAIPMGA